MSTEYTSQCQKLLQVHQSSSILDAQLEHSLLPSTATWLLPAMCTLPLSLTKVPTYAAKHL